MRKSKSPIYLIRRGGELHDNDDRGGTRGMGNKSIKSRSSSSSSSSTGSDDRSGRRRNTGMRKQSRHFKSRSRSRGRMFDEIPRRFRTDLRSLSRGRRSSSSSPDRRSASRRYSRDHSSEKCSLRRTSTNSEETQSLWSRALQKAESSKSNIGQDIQKGKSPLIESAAGIKLPKMKLKSSGKMLTAEKDDPVELISDKLEEETMLEIMGFSDFDSTKGKLVDGNDVSGLPPPATTRKYRQYMNRKGGFNRPLDFTN